MPMTLSSMFDDVADPPPTFREIHVESKQPDYEAMLNERLHVSYLEFMEWFRHPLTEQLMRFADLVAREAKNSESYCNLEQPILAARTQGEVAVTERIGNGSFLRNMLAYRQGRTESDFRTDLARRDFETETLARASGDFGQFGV